MANIQHTESGERLSFYKLFSEKNYKIEIPIIQRDYAQGRDSNEDVRDEFLDALKDYLLEGRPNRDLDFIYGSLLNGEDNKTARFVPLDGQQRLTTLFLLHWYLAIVENELPKFRKVFAESLGENNWKSKFTYETRTSASEFCDALVSFDLDSEKITSNAKAPPQSLSKIIKNQQWYFLSWKNDPTIQGMLVMLDDLQNKFQESSTKFFHQLASSVSPVITFQFLKLEEFGLTDDLYIKMNARGKPLTSFENFKAKFEQQIKDKSYKTKKYVLGANNHKREVHLHKYFSHKIDTDWANLFWAYAKEKLEEAKAQKKEDKNEQIISFDDIIMNLFNTFAINHIAGTADSEKKVRDLIKTNSKELTFNQFKKHGCFNLTSVPKLICLLDILQNKDKKARQFIPGFYYFDENSIEKFLISEFKTAVYTERIMFHAYCEYIIRWHVKGDFNDVEGLKNWMRIVYNLTVNTAPYNNEKEFTNSIKGIDAILESSNNIHDYLIMENTITGFDESQLIEEMLKANLIEKGIDWKDSIYKAEQHGYFKGQIGFLLRLSGITKFYDEKQNCNWDENQDASFRKLLTTYFEKASIIFTDTGLDDKLSKEGNYLWERALLALGDYLIWEGSNQSFLINYDRDISWKRLLKGDKSEHHQEIIQELFDAIDVNNIKHSLRGIKNTYKENDWRKAFIKTPKLFKYFGTKRYVRQNSNHGFVLFRGERMTGKHAELYSYQLFLKRFFENPIMPFANIAYYEATGANDYDIPCVYLNSWEDSGYEIDVSFIEDGFEICFSHEDSKTIHNKLIKILKANGMELSHKYDIKSYIVNRDNPTSVYVFLNNLCSQLQKVKL